MDAEFPSSLRDGRYAVVGLIAEGSQGATLDAVDKLAGRSVAIKRFQVKGARGWKDVELAEREASVLSRLSHRLLPAYLDHFEEQGALYLVMEKVEGDTLAALRRERGTLSRDEVVAFLHDVAEVLAYLHGLDPPVIHRDIKPGNVIRRPDGSFVLVDFGSVRAHLAPKGGSTVVGTFGYMAPEQLQGRALPATDVYSVGTTALTLLTGIEPEDLPHRGLAIDVASALSARADPALAGALASMVEPDPERRASNVASLLAPLAREPKRPEPTANPVADSRASPRTTNPAADPHAPPPTTGPAADSQASPPTTGPVADSQAQPSAVVTQGSGWSVPAVMGFAMVIALTLLRVGIALALRVTVPLVLVLLSIFFGRSLVQAARDVRQAGRRAGNRLKQWQGSVHRAGTEPSSPHSSARRGRWHGDPAAPADPASSGGDAHEGAPRPRGRVRFEAPSSSVPSGRGGRSGRGRHGKGRGRGAPPSAARGPRVQVPDEPPVEGRAGQLGELGLRETIDEIEDAVTEIDREVRRRRS